MTGPKGPARPIKTCVSTCAALALSLGAARAADVLSAAPAPEPAPILPDLSRWYVKVGALGSFSESSSNVYGQSLSTVSVPGVGLVPMGVGPELQIPGRSAAYSNLWSAAFEGGYSFTPNWSVEVATGFPVWSTVRINGYSPDGPPSGTVLGRVMPGGVPITGVYRFTQFGKFQPYLGAGISPTFAWAVQDGYATGTSYQSTLALILQGGFDYMFDKHWGLFFDVKQGFVGGNSNSTGINAGAPLGIVTFAGAFKTNARPVTFATGISYRF
jgi:outer membrane protein